MSLIFPSCAFPDCYPPADADKVWQSGYARFK